MHRPAFLGLFLIALPLAVDAGPPPPAKAPAPAPTARLFGLSLPGVDRPKGRFFGFTLAELAQAAGKESPRLQKLKQLTFNRRPSAILRCANFFE